jgi:hypothetical protein
LGDDHARRPQDAVAEAVALLEHFEDGAVVLLGRLREERLVDVRVEVAVRLDFDETLFAERLWSSRWTRRTPSSTFPS